MDKKENEVNVLDEVNKGACMGKDAVRFLLDKTKSDSLKHDLLLLLHEYEKILGRIKELYPHYSWDKPHETNAMNKMMAWYGINMKTMTDQSNSKISELLMQGTNMGIIEGRRLLNHKDTKEEINKIVERYVEVQETAVEKLKTFL